MSSCPISKLFPAQPSCVSWEDVLSPSRWGISRQPRASYLHLHHRLPVVMGSLTSSLPTPGVRGETCQAGAPRLPWCSSREVWLWSAALCGMAGSHVPSALLSGPQRQEGLLTSSLTQILLPRKGVCGGCLDQSLVGLVDETYCCVTHWVPWGGWWGSARTPLAVPALSAPHSCAPPDIFQGPSTSWLQPSLSKRMIFGVNSIWHEPV